MKPIKIILILMLFWGETVYGQTSMRPHEIYIDTLSYTCNIRDFNYSTRYEVHFIDDKGTDYLEMSDQGGIKESVVPMITNRFFDYIIKEVKIKFRILKNDLSVDTTIEKSIKILPGQSIYKLEFAGPYINRELLFAMFLKIEDPIKIISTIGECIVNDTIYINYSSFHDNGFQKHIMSTLYENYRVINLNVELSPNGGIYKLFLDPNLFDYLRGPFRAGIGSAYNNYSIYKQINQEHNATYLISNNIVFDAYTCYDYPILKIPKPVVCEGDYLRILGQYFKNINYTLSDFDIYLETKLASGTNDWVPIKKNSKVYAYQELSFDDITDDPTWYGKEILLRPYLYTKSKRLNGDISSGVFLPKPRMTITGKSPCYKKNNGNFTITFNDIPSEGASGGSIPLLVNIKKYDLYPIAEVSDVYVPIDTLGHIYYYTKGLTIPLNVTGNSITIDSSTIAQVAPADAPNFKLSAGLYLISAQFQSEGNNMCPETKVFKLEELTQFNPTVTGVPLPENSNYHIRTGQSTGTVQFTFDGGKGPYKVIKNSSTIIETNNKTETLTETNQFNTEEYTYYVQDANQCPGSGEKKVTLTRPSDITIVNGKPSNVDCNANDAGSNANGKVSWTITGGVQPYSVTLYREGTTEPIVTNSSSSDFSGALITPGKYYITVNDALNTNYNKRSTGEIEVGEPSQLTLSVSPIDNHCYNGNAGSFTFTPGGGNGGYTYVITKNGETNPSINGQLTAGAYSIKINDAKNCNRTINDQSIGQPLLPITLATTCTRPMSCLEVSNGEVTATVNNFQANNTSSDVSFWIGTNKLTIKSSSISGKNGTFVLSNLPQTTGTTITVKDLFNCAASDNVIIPLKSPLFSIDPATIKSAPCTGKYGIITINPKNGEGLLSTYQFKTDNVVSNDTILLKGNSIHNFLVTDSVGCTAGYLKYKVVTRTDSLKLAEVLTNGVTPAWCTSSNNGSLSVHTTSNGVGNVKYKRIGESQTSPSQPSGIFSNLFPKTYTIVANDDSLCTDTTTVVVPVRNDSLNIKAINSVRAACEGNSPSGEIKVSRYTNNQKTGYGNITYTLGSTSQPDTLFKNRISGHYTINAVDQMNCPASASVDVEFNSNPVTLTIDSVFDQTCNEVANARIYLKAHTATAKTEQTFKFTYNGVTTDWNKDTVSYKLNTAGDYSFSVTDINNCGTTIAHTINNLKQAPKPKLTFVDSVACASAGNGALTITNDPKYSKAKYRYTLGTLTKYASSYSEEITFPNLSKGYYIITAWDTLGCQDTARFFVGVKKDSVHISGIRTVLSSCIDAKNGVAVIKASSADPTNITDKYTFRIVGQSLSNENIDLTKKGDSATFTSLPVNKSMYTITVSDRFGCKNSESSFAIKAREHILNLERRSVINTSCIEKNDGKITFRRKYGDEKFRFDVTSAGYSKAFYTTDTLVKVTELPDGIYNIVVRDTSNCSASIEDVVITDPQEIEFASVYNNYIQHKGEPEGIVEAKVWKGNDKYNYEWFTKTNNNWTSIEKGQAYSPSAIRLNSLNAGDYLLRVQDTAACKVGTAEFLERNFTLIEPEKDLTLSIKSLRNASCFGSSDGEFVIEASGGWGNQYKYGYDANPDNMDIINRFTGRKKENITMFAADTSKAIVSISINIDEPAMLTASLSSKQDVTCYGEANGSATLNILGGNYPHYFISSNNLNWEKGYTKHNLSVGRSTLYIRDTLNCATSTPVEIDLSGPAQIVETSQITKSLCGFNNGKIISVVSGGKAPYTYQWYLGDILLPLQTNKADSLFSGSYRLVVTDDFACSREFNLPVSDITDLTIDNVLTTPVTCWEYTDGKASIQISKGNPEYIITWPDKSGGFSVSGLKEGTYTVGVTDQEKCKVFRDFTIGTPVQIYLAENRIANPLCEGRDDGSIDITAAGDFSGFDYTWSTGRKGNTIRSLAPGTYTVTVADDHNCSNAFDFNLQYQNFVKPSLGNDITLCKGNSVQLKAGAFSTYAWGSTTGLKSSEPNITVSEPASYSVEVKDDYGCIGRDTINIAQSATEMTGKLLIATYIAQRDTVMIFEASWPLPDSVKFELEGCKVLQTGKYFREVIFADTGTYRIGLVSYLNDCSDHIEKMVVVEPRAASALKSAQSRMIKSFKASPNPNNGVFDVEILLRESATARLRLINISTGITTDVREYKGSDIYTINYNQRLTPGMYLLHLQVGSEAQTKTLIIQ